MTNNHSQFRAKIIQNIDIAKDTKQFRFRIEEGGPDSFSPGQFFLMQIDQKTHRSYSIASSPRQMPEFDLQIKYMKDGAASEFLWNNVDVGSEILFRGPMGRFGIQHPEKKQLLVATGTGLAPMRSIWQFLVQENGPKIHLIFGVRHIANVFSREEMEELKQKFPKKFDYTICLSRPEGEVDFEFYEGRVTDYVKKFTAEDVIDTEVSLCGSKDMVDQMKEFLSEQGVEKEMINVESW